jgi:hypothetical protein
MRQFQEVVMSTKISSEKNQELQEKASRDNEKGERNPPSTWRGPGDVLFGISQEYLDKKAEIYNDAWDKC